MENNRNSRKICDICIFCYFNDMDKCESFEISNKD